MPELVVPAWAWGLLAGVMLVLIAVDLFAHRGDRVDSRRRALIWSVVWIGVAVAFGVLVAVWFGSAAAEQYFAAYLLEKSLSVDNLFLFVVVFAALGIPAEEQRPDDSPRQHAALLVARNPERAEDDHEQKQIVDAQTFLEQVRGEVLLRRARPEVHRHETTEHHRGADPADAPHQRAAARIDPVTAMGEQVDRNQYHHEACQEGPGPGRHDEFRHATSRGSRSHGDEQSRISET